MRGRGFKVLVLALALCGSASAAKVTVSDAWIRALPAHLPAAGYFTAHNNGQHDVDITGAQALACGSLMLHLSSDDKGMGSMRQVDKVTVPAGGNVKFATVSYHLSVLEQDGAGSTGDGLLRHWLAPATDVQKHYGYAFQWFAIAAGIAFLYVWHRFVRPGKP